MEQPRIVTPCPSCGNTTLFIGSGGNLTCSWLECKQPVVLDRIAELERQNAELQSELEAARRDAERYRWLRVNLIQSFGCGHHLRLAFPPGGTCDLDTQIDAARAAGVEHGDAT